MHKIYQFSFYTNFVLTSRYRKSSFNRIIGDESDFLFWTVALHYLRKEQGKRLCTFHKVIKVRCFFLKIMHSKAFLTWKPYRRYHFVPECAIPKYFERWMKLFQRETAGTHGNILLLQKSYLN